ncbi:MAG: MBL fold metallo-hydrolase [Elusimicrobiaceae bacterium]
MRIKFWGARGSIAVSGGCFNRYGGDTACLEITGESGETVIIDAGTGIRRLGKKLAAQDVSTYHILFTHYHWDHILGFPFFAPIYKKNMAIKISGCPHSDQSVSAMIAKTMEPPNFPVPYQAVSASFVEKKIEPKQSFEAGGMKVESVPLSHPNGGSGYKFTENGKTFVFLTDNELGFKHPGGLGIEGYAEFCRGADLLIHDGEYRDEEYHKRGGWGHSTFGQAVELAVMAGVPKLCLFHHNQERSDSEIDLIVDFCREKTQGGTFEIVAASTDLEVEV